MTTDVLIVGAGVAGLAAALAVDGRSVFVASETPLGRDLASAWAQGGVAAALARDDSPRLHADDTVAAGAGIVEHDAVETLASEAPAAVDVLVRLGVPFARDVDGRLALGLEAAHGRRRIVHAADATGAAIVDVLLAAARARANIRLDEGLRATALLQRADGRIVGATFVTTNGEEVSVGAGAVILATGGFGGLYARTTTPAGARGSGIALAARVGATLADLEFVQFHPTALRVGTDPLPLVSEAVRGEGAILVDADGTPIMKGLDPRGDLAPRDVVARAVSAAEASGKDVLLDARSIGARFGQRFPGIFAAAQRAGIDPRTQPLPVTAATHYTIGGVATDTNGRTSVPGLWACGEVAATGVHGANRLASNSLLEGLVFGTRAGHDIASTALQRIAPPVLADRRVRAAASTRGAMLAALREATSAGLGVVRDAAGIARALETFAAIERSAQDDRVVDAAFVAAAVARAALTRCESRGAHFRADYPFTDARWAHRSFVERPQLARTS